MNLIKRYPLSLLEVITIWVVCLIPVPETPLDDVAFIDKWTHFVMYGTLSLTIWMEYYRNNHAIKPLLSRESILFAFLLPVIQGGLIELAQKYLTTCRSGDWLDFVCNTLGVVLGTLLATIIIRIIKLAR